MTDESDWSEVRATFEECTCEHDPGEHTWGGCGIEGCGCEGGWFE